MFLQMPLAVGHNLIYYPMVFCVKLYFEIFVLNYSSMDIWQMVLKVFDTFGGLILNSYVNCHALYGLSGSIGIDINCHTHTQIHAHAYICNVVNILQH